MNRRKTISDFFAIGIMLLLLLIEYRFFFLIKIPDFIQKTMTYHNKLLIFIISIVFFIVYGLYKKKLLFTYEIVVFLSLILISIFYSYEIYNPQLNEIIIPAVSYLMIILYFPLRKVLVNNISLFIKLLSILNIMACLTLITQYTVFTFNRTVFLSIYEFYRSGEIAIRNGDIRITYLGTIISLSCIISIGVLINTSKKIEVNRFMHVSNILLSLIYFQFISQTRMYVVSILATIIIQFYFVLSDKNNKWLKRILFLIGLVFVSYSFGIVDFIIQLIAPIRDGSYIYDGSYYARLDSIEFFSEVIKNHPFSGNGILDPNVGSPHYYQIHGLKGQSYYSDVGILGTVAQFGLPMFFWYVFLLYKIFIIRKRTNDLLINSLFLFVIITSATLIVLDPQRMLFLIITLAIIDVMQAKFYSNKFM